MPKARQITISKRAQRKLDAVAATAAATLLSTAELVSPEASAHLAPQTDDNVPADTVTSDNITSAQPTIAAATPASTINERSDARRAAAKAVAAFYAGTSLPFKSAHDLKRKAPINFALTRAPSARSAALLAAIICYCDVQADLTFIRGSGRVPGRLLGFTGNDAEHLFPAGPESGGLSNLIPDRVSYISGELSGAGCENAVFRINPEAARDNLRAFNTKQADGEHLFSGALALLDMLAAPADTTSDTAAE